LISVFIVAAHIADGGKESAGVYSTKMFPVYVKRAVEEYFLKNSKVRIDLPEKYTDQSDPVKRFALYEDEMKTIAFRVFKYRDVGNAKAKEQMSDVRLYFHEDGSHQICIVEVRPARGLFENHDKAFRASLRTLDISPDAGTKRLQYRRTRGL
jgi:hypothetical protein